MTCHVLHAGDGYTYLTEQVASGDVERDKGDELTAYYQQEGNPPGKWVGRGCAELGVSGEVSEAHMQALFGEGLHPEADAHISERIANGDGIREAIDAERLGRRFARYDRDVPLAVELRHAYERFETDNDRRPTIPERRQIKEQTAYALMVANAPEGPDPTRAEVRQYIQNELGRSRQPVAGFDLVFTPVKGMSVLWGLGDHELRSSIERIHNEAWQEAVDWLEQEAAFTRAGAGGIAQLDTHGLVATAFQHRDSRAGDPNLHTHVTVSNRVLGSDGVWRTLDSKQLHHVAVTASEVYNAKIEEKAATELGIAFDDVEKGDGKRPVREVSGLPTEWLRGFSRRREKIEQHYDQLVADYTRQYGRTPPRTVQIGLAQQATLTTREGKTELPTMAELVQQWTDRAQQLRPDLDVAETILQATQRTEQQDVDIDVEVLAATVVATVAEHRATWSVYHLRAETERQLRGAINPEQRDELVHQVVARARDVESLSLEVDPEPTPTLLQRADGSSVFRRHQADRYTSEALLEAEDRLVHDATTPRGSVVADAVRGAALHRLAHQTDRVLNEGQRDLVQHFTGCGQALAVGIGPPGTGKSTAMRAVREVWESTGGRVLGLAPSAAAAEVLSQDLEARAETLHSLTAAWRNGAAVDVTDGDMLLVDEAGMAGTMQLDTLRDIAAERGAVVRLVGDHRQLTAVEAGGALRLLHHEVGGVELSEIHRFHRADEAQAVLDLRVGNEAAVEWYADNDRLHGGIQAAVVDQLYRDWTQDLADGHVSLMISDSGEAVRELSARAQTERRAANLVERTGVDLHDETQAGIGDRIVTRRNRRRLQLRGGRDFVKNGDLWEVADRDNAGRLRVRHLEHGGTTWLPADYVANHVELGYATTVHRSQGMTVDRGRMYASSAATREHATVGLSRGRDQNHAYLDTDAVLDTDEPEVMAGDLFYGYRSRDEVGGAMTRVLRREGAEQSATEQLREAQQAPYRLDRVVPQYEYARFVHRGEDATEQAETWLRTAMPEYAGQILADEAWPALAQVLTEVADTGSDPIAVLTEAAEQRELDTAQSTAQVMHWRVLAVMPDPTGDPLRPGQLPGWVATPPSPEDDTDRGDDVAELGTWLRQQAQVIADRVEWLGEQAAQQQPAWTRSLGAVPDDPIDRQIWQLRAGQVAAYREHFAVPETDTSLYGPRGYASQQRACAWVQRYVALADPRERTESDEHSLSDETAAAIDDTSGPAVTPETAEELLAAARQWTEGAAEPAAPAELPARTPAPGQDPQVDRAAAVNADAAAWFSDQLDASPQALEYLHSRIPDVEAARGRFTVGYAPSGWRGLVAHLREQGFDDHDLVQAGVAKESRNGWLIDQFRDRLMMTWHDEHGRVAGFTGRDLSGQHPAKYLNTPATVLFDKSELCFGLHEQRDRLAGGATPVVVEGSLDVLALASVDPQQRTIAPVSASGTAVTDRHLDTVQRHNRADELVIGLDQDAAGQTAAARTVDRAARRWPDTRVATLPEGYDPADYVAEQYQHPSLALAPYTERAQQRPAARWLAERAVDAYFAARPDQHRSEVEGQLGAARAAAQALAPVDLGQASQAAIQVAQRLEMDPAHMAAMLGAARMVEQPHDRDTPLRAQEQPSAETGPSRADHDVTGSSSVSNLAERARALRERTQETAAPPQQSGQREQRPAERASRDNSREQREAERRRSEQERQEQERAREQQEREQREQQQRQQPDQNPGLER